MSEKARVVSVDDGSIEWKVKVFSVVKSEVPIRKYQDPLTARVVVCIFMRKGTWLLYPTKVAEFITPAK